MKTLQKGFTLIELLITIAIIGALAAIAVPTYLNYLQNSELDAVERNCDTAGRFLKQEYAKMFTVPGTLVSDSITDGLTDSGRAISPLDSTVDAFEITGGTAAGSTPDEVGEVTVVLEEYPNGLSGTGAAATANGTVTVTTVEGNAADFVFNKSSAYIAYIECDVAGTGSSTGNTSTQVKLSL